MCKLHCRAADGCKEVVICKCTVSEIISTSLQVHESVGSLGKFAPCGIDGAVICLEYEPPGIAKTSIDKCQLCIARLWVAVEGDSLGRIAQ